MEVWGSWNVFRFQQALRYLVWLLLRSTSSTRILIRNSYSSVMSWSWANAVPLLPVTFGTIWQLWQRQQARPPRSSCRHRRSPSQTDSISRVFMYIKLVVWSGSGSGSNLRAWVTAWSTASSSAPWFTASSYLPDHLPHRIGPRNSTPWVMASRCVTSTP
jgi:hypothetical protein